jgi:hypothetical protein
MKTCYNGTVPMGDDQAHFESLPVPLTLTSIAIIFLITTNTPDGFRRRSLRGRAAVS